MNRLPRRFLRLSAPVLVAAAFQAQSPSSITRRNPITRHTSACDAQGQSKPKPNFGNIIVHPEFKFEGEGDGEEYALKFEDGTMYQGETFHDQIHGTGKLRLYDGTIYIGTFAHGKLEGFATILAANTVYVGETKDWMPHGIGKLTDATGTVCEGCFYQGQLNGHATMTGADGSVYDGEFENSNSKGHGKYTCSEFTSVGLFEDFQLVEGTMTFTDGCVEQGTFVGNRLNGWGKSVWKNGTVVEGEYVNGEPVGVITVTRDGVNSTHNADSVTFMYLKMRRYVGI